MRWDNLGESPAALFGTDVVSRTFDTPNSAGSPSTKYAPARS